MKPTLLIIDVQKTFYKNSRQAARSLENSIEYFKEAIKTFRIKNLRIVCIQHMDDDDNLVSGEKMGIAYLQVAIRDLYGIRQQTVIVNRDIYPNPDYLERIAA